MSARVIFIGLDAAEATLLNKWADEGHLPTFAKLTREGVSGRLDNCMETLPGAVWPEICTGRSGGKLGEFYHPTQLRSGESRMRPLREDDIDPEDYFWAVASRAGKRVCMVDMVQTVPTPNINGIEVREWGLHDRNFSLASQPPGLIEELNEKHGQHPMQWRACDNVAQHEGYEVLLEHLLKGARIKSNMLLDLLQREEWDLFACAYGEPHCVGHQFWHFFDPNHPSYDPDAPQALKDSIIDIYKLIDEGIAKLIEAAGPDANVLVATSHGVRLFTGGPLVLPEFIARLGLGSGGSSALGSTVRHLHNRARYLPWNVKKMLRKVLEVGGIREMQQKIGASLDPFETDKTRAATVRNNRIGAIRLNLKGRDPHGSVAPGNEEMALIDDIRTALYELEKPGTGQKIVEKVVTAREAFGPDCHPDVPDILVVFRTDVGIIEECWSERVGHIKAPINSPGYPRTGDHSILSWLWMAGPDVPAGGHIEEGALIDIAPTILAMLGVPVPEKVDGHRIEPVRGQPAAGAKSA